MKRILIILTFLICVSQTAHAGLFSMIAASEASDANKSAQENSERINKLESKVDRILEILESQKD